MSALRRPLRPDQHGTQTGYQYGCRCARCTEAQRLYMVDLRARHAEGAAVNPVGKHRHPDDDTTTPVPRPRTSRLVKLEEWMSTPGKPCDGHTNTWFAFTEEGQEHSAEACQTCPVIEQCDTYAEEHRIDHGVWGGLTERERRRQRRARLRAQNDKQRRTA